MEPIYSPSQISDLTFNFKEFLGVLLSFLFFLVGTYVFSRLTSIEENERITLMPNTIREYVYGCIYAIFGVLSLISFIALAIIVIKGIMLFFKITSLFGVVAVLLISLVAWGGFKLYKNTR